MKQEDLLKSRVDLEDMLDIQNGLKEAEKDDTPFAVVTSDGVNVAGDVNKTEIKSKDYHIRFRFPKAMAGSIDKKDIIQEVGDYVLVNVEFNDVHITPRRDMEIIASIVKILPYFKKYEESKAEYRSVDEMATLIKEVSIDIGDDLYDVVAAILNVDQSIKDYMVFTDVLNMVGKIKDDFPEAFNEGDTVFDYSSQES